MLEDLSSAVANFAEWQAPWRFADSVRESLRSEASRVVFEAAWGAALASDHWTSDDLSACAAQAESALREAFPAFPRHVTAAIVRAAAYQWR